LTSARKGKLASFPLRIREEVNLRLLDGEAGPRILAWLNALPDVLRILDERWGEQPVSDQNLSEWRQGGYKDWLAKRERVANIGELSKYAAQLGVAAGGNVNDGSAAILGGRLLETIERALDPADPSDPSAPSAAPAVDLKGLVKCVVALRASDRDAATEKQRDRSLAQRDRLLDQRERAVKLAEESFQVKTAQAFLKWYENARAQEIVAGKGTTTVKVEELRKLMFGDDEEFTPTPLNP